MSATKIAANAGSGAAARLLSAALGLALIILMTRLWDANSLGRYVVAYSWFQLLQLVPLLGLHFELAREAARDVEAAGPELATATVLSLACVLPTGAALLGFGALLYPGELLPALGLAAAALIPTAPITVAEMALTGRERLKLVALVNIGESLLRCLVIAGLILAGAGVTAVLGAFVALRCAALAFYLTDPAVRAALAPRAFSRATIRGQLARAPVLLTILVLSSAFARLDVALLPLFADLDAIGVYGIATRLYELCLMFPAILVMALLPVFTRVSAPDPWRLEALMLLVLRYALALGIPLALVGATLSDPFLSLVFGPRFAAAAPAFQILVAATLVTGVNQVMSCALLARNLQRLELQCLVAGCAVLLVGIALLAPRYGIAGAAASVLAGTLAQAILRERLLRQRTGIHLARRELAGPLLGGAAALALAAIRPAGPYSDLAALAAYAAVLLFCRSVQQGDGRRLQSLLIVEQPGASAP